MLRSSIAVTVAMLAAPLAAQFTVVIPNGTATTAGNIGQVFPWSINVSSVLGVRLMCVYDAANFTNQGITSPVLITRLRWRPNDGYPAFTGGTFAQASVELSTSPIDFLQVAANFVGIHGADRTVVHAGPITYPAGNGGPGGGVPAPWTVDIPLVPQFVYDPAGGDLVIDCDVPGVTNFQGGTLPTTDAQSPAQATIVWASTQYPNAHGRLLNLGSVVEVTCVPAAGAATARPYGAGCYDTARATFYETFAPGGFDLSNTSRRLLPTGTGYVVVPSAATWFSPVSAPLPMPNHTVTSPLPLGFTLNYPGGSTNTITVSNNGFVWAQPSADQGCCAGNAFALRQLGARWCPLWTDLNPTMGGTVFFDTDPANSAAYVTFSGVVESLTTNQNTFQIAFFANGQVEYRYQACSVQNLVAVTGWSPGNGASDPGSVDLSASPILVTSPDLHALRLATDARPIVGTNVTLMASGVPTGSPLGAFLGGQFPYEPGAPLAQLGMPGCFLHITPDATRVFVPTGSTGSMAFTVPNVPALSGTHLCWQAAAFAPGLNPLGVISSNGLDLRIGTQ